MSHSEEHEKQHSTVCLKEGLTINDDFWLEWEKLATMFLFVENIIEYEYLFHVRSVNFHF